VVAVRVVLEAAGPEGRVVLAGAVRVAQAEREVVGPEAQVVLAVSVQAWGPGRRSGPGQKPE
jgi:hypothetical protein